MEKSDVTPSILEQSAAVLVSHGICNTLRRIWWLSEVKGNVVCRCASCTELLLRRGKPLCPICRRGVQSYILREFEV